MDRVADGSALKAQARDGRRLAGFATWRNIYLRSGEGQSVARVEDNVHEFIVTVRHDNQSVTDVSGTSLRVPWVTCPGAAPQLQRLRGINLAQPRYDIDPGLQCTHMLDLAKLAIAHTQRGGERHYAITVTPETEASGCTARLSRDGAPLFEWKVINNIVQPPGPFAGHVISGSANWPEAVKVDSDMLEAAMVLRRGLLVYRGRPLGFDAVGAFEMPYMKGACHSFQPERMRDAVRPPGFKELS